jgi:hypothetical protein
MTAALRKRSASDWKSRLEASGVPCGVVKGVRDAVQAVNGSSQTGIPPLPPGSVRRVPPKLNEHGAIIRRLGWQAFDV